MLKLTSDADQYYKALYEGNAYEYRLISYAQFWTKTPTLHVVIHSKGGGGIDPEPDGMVAFDEVLTAKGPRYYPSGPMHCRKCNELYPMAEPNMNDGTLVCWACRNYK